MFCVFLNQWVRAFLSLSNGWERWKNIFFPEIPVGANFSTVFSRSDTNSDTGPHPLCHISINVSNTHIMHDNAHSKSWRERSCKVSGPRNEQWYVLSIKEITELAGGKWMTDTSPTQTLKNTFIVSKLHWLSEPRQLSLPKQAICIWLSREACLLILALT